jgi:hypothetical protein
MPRSFPHLSQPDAMDCGATCLAICLNYDFNMILLMTMILLIRS